MTPSEELASLTWPLARAAEAIEALAHRRGLSPGPVELPPPPPEPALGAWIEAAAARAGLEAEPAETSYAEAGQLVRGAGPALLRLPAPGEPGFLAVLRAGRRGVWLLGPDLALHRRRPETIRAALCAELEAPLLPEIDRLLAEAGVPQQRRARARAAILRERLSLARVRGCWLLRLPPGAGLWAHARDARLPRHLLTFAGAHTVQYLLWLAAWWVVGRGALQGRVDRGWLLAWALLLLTLIPFRLLATWAQGIFSMAAGARLKARLLYGALRLDPDEIRHQGVGQLLGRVIESETVETLALQGGFLALLAGIELLIATAILAAGAGGGQHALLLLGWLGLTLLQGWRFFGDRQRWTRTRLAMTHDLVEQMVGHRTRLAQQTREQWHDGEDQLLARYLALSRVMDRAIVRLRALVPRGWLLLGLAGLAPAFVSGRGSPAALAIGLGGILLAFQALERLVTGIAHLAGAVIAWQQVAPLFHAAGRPETAGTPAAPLAPAPVQRGEAGRPILHAHDLVFRYRPRAEPVLRGCHLRICAGDRLLLEGPSGGGKSTLAALLIGLRQPESGLLLLDGLDRQTLGADGWRQRVAAAPQFHENHVLTETFAFNLLMGRRWPPHPEDIRQAETICHELGLGELLDRMPAGLLQMVGETGWQLSHGERSRLYLARALLQGADLIILDESFAALDPENLERALRCVLNRARTLLVIAHP